MSDYPEYDKLQAVEGESQVIGEFLEWLHSTKRVKLHQSYSFETDELGKPVYRNRDGEIVEDWQPPHIWDKPHVVQETERRQDEEGIDRRLVRDPGGEACLPLHESTEDLLAEFFGIDLDLRKLDTEQRAMLELARKVEETRGQ